MLGFCFYLMVSHTKDRPERIIKMWHNKMTSNLSSSTITTVMHIKSNIACYNFPEAPKIPNTIAAMMTNTTNVSIRHIFWFCHHILRCSRLDCAWKTWELWSSSSAFSTRTSSFSPLSRTFSIFWVMTSCTSCTCRRTLEIWSVSSLHGSENKACKGVKI